MNEIDHDGCTTQCVARSAVGAVVACPSCGNLQLTLDYLTVRFQPAAFRELVGMLVFAQTRLDGDPALRAALASGETAAAAPSAPDKQVH
jgi:hypothetical protein